MEQRSQLDFSALRDEEIYNSWIMNYDSMMPVFRMIYEQRADLCLLDLHLRAGRA